MKRAKLILSAIGILAVVGGAFAFKATKATRIQTIYYYAPASTLPCSYTINTFLSLTNTGLVTTYYTTIPTTLPPSLLPTSICHTFTTQAL
jgi:hypothetical protein